MATITGFSFQVEKVKPRAVMPFIQDARTWQGQDLNTSTSLPVLRHLCSVAHSPCLQCN